MTEQIGACGIYCSFCPTFRLEHKRCFGCEWVNEQLRKKRESKKGCTFWECTQDKNIKCCFQCKDFPCKTHYNRRRAIYTKQALDTWKELQKTGMTFGEKKEK